MITRNRIRTVLTLAAVSMVLLGLSACQQVSVTPQSPSMEVISMDPASPAVLDPGQRLYVKFRYDSGGAESIQTWVRPDGKSRGSKSHPCGRITDKEGVYEGWFFFEDNAAEVKSVKLRMRDNKDKHGYIFETSIPVDYKWKAPQSDGPRGYAVPGTSVKILSSDPVLPAVLKQGEEFKVKFQYEVGDANSITIQTWPKRKNSRFPSGYKRNFNNSKNSIGVYEYSMLYDKPESMKGVRFRMTDDDTSRVLLEYFFPVDVRWKSQETVKVQSCDVTTSGQTEFRQFDLIDAKVVKEHAVKMKDDGLTIDEGEAQGNKLEFLVLPERMVSFPADRSIGMLKIRKWDPDASWPDEDLAEARGEVKVPAGYMLGLKIAREKTVDLSPLADLNPTDLQNLSLYRTKVQDADLRYVSHLTGLMQMGFGMTNIGDEGLAHIASLKLLKELNIAQTKITDAGLIYLSKLSELETLSLQNNSITNKGLIQLRGLKNLKHLILKNTKITDEGLFHLNKLKSLESLTLSQTDIKGHGLLQLRDLSSLEWLQLGSTSINDAILMHIGTMKKLKGLYLNETQITDIGIGYLRNLDQLEQLVLRETKITDRCLEHLAGLSNLKSLNLQKTSISKSALEALMQALPNCNIMHSEMQSLKIPVLVGQLGDKDGMKRSIAMNNLSRIGKPAVGALVEALKDENLEARKGAAGALGLMGPGAKDAIVALVDVLKGDDKSLYVSAGYSLVKIEESPFPMTMGLLKDGKLPVRRAIVENLGGFGSKAVGLLIQALKDKDSMVRMYACWGLKSIGPEAKDAIGALTLATQDDDKNIRKEAVEALKKIRPTGNKSNVQVEGEYTVILKVLGRKVYLKDINPSEDQQKKYQNDKTQEQFNKWLKQRQESGIRSVVFGTLFREYIKSEGIEATDAEIKEYRQAMDQLMAEPRLKWRQARDKLMEELDDPEIEHDRKLEIESQIEKFEKILGIREQEKSTEASIGMAKRFIGTWKANKSLFEKYGGRVVFQQGGPEPLDAYREFLKQQEVAGRFEIMNEQAADLFWNYFTNDDMHTFFSDESKAVKSMNTPWWLMNRVDDSAKQ